MSEGWGPGKERDAAGFELGHLDDGTPYELFFGEFPHSRSDDRIYARFANAMGAEGERVVGFAGHRIMVKIELATMNYLKTSGFSGDEVRKGGLWRVWLNGYEVYSDTTRDPFEALLVIRRKLYELMDLPVRLYQGESPVGRQVYYYAEPAEITAWLPDQGCVILRKDHSEDGVPVFAQRPWRDEDGSEEQAKDDILSPHIWWWRKEPGSQP